MVSARKVTLEDSHVYFSIRSNQAAIENHIWYFEEQVQDEIRKPDCTYLFSPNFAAWLKFYTEFITNWLFWRYFESQDQEDWATISNKGYSEIKKKIKKELGNGSELDDILHKIKLIIELRHCFVHGGAPNFLRPIGRSSGFGDVKEDEIISMIDPKNFNRTKKIFESVYDKIKKKVVIPTFSI